MQALQVAARHVFGYRIKRGIVTFCWAACPVARCRHPGEWELRYDAERRQLLAKQVAWWVCWARLQRCGTCSYPWEWRPGAAEFLAFDQSDRVFSHMDLTAAGRACAAQALEALHRLSPQAALLEARRQFSNAPLCAPTVQATSAFWRGPEDVYYALFWCGFQILHTRLPSTLGVFHEIDTFFLGPDHDCYLARAQRRLGKFRFAIHDSEVHKAPAVMRLVVRRLVLDMDQHYGSPVASAFFEHLLNRPA
jgi:hypothetical protein